MIAGDSFKQQSYSIHIYKFESLSQQMDELDFDSIVSGEQPKQQKQENKPQIKEHEKKMTKTEARERQQSCMISDIDKDLLPSSTKNNPTNFRVSLSDMLAIDKNDQSLQNYKKQLLGNIKEQQLKEDQVAEVQIFKVEVVCPGRPGGNINLDFQHTDPKQKRFFQLKEGSTYCLRVHFKVRYDIVFGLKFVNNVFKMFAKVDKDQQKMGSFAPQQKLHVFDLPWNQAPSGLLARGQYKGKGLFLDNDGIVHCQFDYVMKIDKQW